MENRNILFEMRQIIKTEYTSKVVDEEKFIFFCKKYNISLKIPRWIY